MLYFDHTDGKDRNFHNLSQELDENLNQLVGGFENRKEYVQYNTLDIIHDVFVVYDNEKAIGCAGFHEYDEQTAELKRVYLKEAYRGGEIALHMLQLVEHAAEKKGYRYMILETGRNMMAAARLYEKAGYKPIENFGPYIHMPNSICMRKKLVH